jgi:hypothetical protein
MPLELRSAIDEANATSIYITHVVDNIERSKSESSDVSSNTKRRMPRSAISQCRLRSLRPRL